DAPQLSSGSLAPPHARDDREGAVLLYVGVCALVDEARLRVILGLVRPRRDEVVVERGAARRATVGCTPFQEMHRVRNGEQMVLADRVADLLMRSIGAAANRFLLGRCGIVAARCGDQQLLDQTGT